uniref:Uncharacterized protein n=1 Tax=Tanacetum cinerariifolium TaxID=118510 RepID=A0A699IR28_TANCI|nr:hypothetical protein [Tanacetum cinerariifolium]
MKITCGKSLSSKRPAAKQYTMRLRPLASDASESTVGFSYDMKNLYDDLASIKAGSCHLRSSKEIAKESIVLSLESIHSKPLMPARSSFSSSPTSKHIYGLL